MANPTSKISGMMMFGHVMENSSAMMLIDGMVLLLRQKRDYPRRARRTRRRKSHPYYYPEKSCFENKISWLRPSVRRPRPHQTGLTFLSSKWSPSWDGNGRIRTWMNRMDRITKQLRLALHPVYPVHPCLIALSYPRPSASSAVINPELRCGHRPRWVNQCNPWFKSLVAARGRAGDITSSNWI